MNADDARKQAQEAEALQDNRLLASILSEMETDAIETMIQATAAPDREAKAHAVKALREIRTIIAAKLSQARAVVRNSQEK